MKAEESFNEYMKKKYPDAYKALQKWVEKDGLTTGTWDDEEVCQLMESYAQEKYRLPNDKEIERIRQLGKEKYYIGSSQSAYSGGFMDCINWIRLQRI